MTANHTPRVVLIKGGQDEDVGEALNALYEAGTLLLLIVVLVAGVLLGMAAVRFWPAP